VSILFPAKDRGFASGLVNCGTRLGLAFGAPLIASVVAVFGWKNAFFLLGFTSLIWLIPWIASFPRGANTAEFAKPRSPREKWGRVDRSLLGVCVANIGYGYYFYLLVTWLPTYLVQVRHLPLKTAGAYALIPYLTFALGEPIGGWLADRLVATGLDETLTRKTVIVAAFLTGIMLILAGVAASAQSSIVLLAVASLVGLSSGNLYALVQRISREGNVGFSVGVFNLAGNISGIAAPLITGFIIAKTGSYFPAFVVAVIMLLAVLPPYWLIVKTPTGPTFRKRPPA
jgi:MFS transporter, ACS family, D-galactonate transporter